MTFPRTLPEWIGASPDAAVPPRVRLRIFDRYQGRCQCGCNRLIRPGLAEVQWGHRQGIEGEMIS